MINDGLRILLNYNDKRSFTYLSQVVNFFYSNFDNLTHNEKETLYKELEETRLFLNSPRTVSVTLKDRSVVKQVINISKIKKEDIYPQIYNRYEEYIRILNIEQKPRTLTNFLKSLFKLINVKNYLLTHTIK